MLIPNNNSLKQFGLIEGKLEYDFFQRLYSGEHNRYGKRLKQIGLVNKSYILDAGCGFGQWTNEIAKLNKKEKD